MADVRLVSDVKSAEGCNLVAYRDSKGLWTIGYGHLLDQTIDWTGHTITQATADGLLANDLDERAGQAAGLPEWSALDTDCRRNAVVECIFNLGYGNWRREFPKARAAIGARQWMIASQELLDSPQWIRDVGLHRVARLADYLAEGCYSA